MRASIFLIVLAFSQVFGAQASAMSNSCPLLANERSIIPLYALQSKIVGNIHETTDGRDWSIALVQRVLGEIQQQNGVAVRNVLSREGLHRLILIDELLTSEIRDSNAWPSYSAGAIRRVLDRLNTHALVAIQRDSSAKENPDADFLSAIQFETQLQRLRARIEASQLQTQDGRDWSNRLVLRVLNHIQELNTEVLNMSSDLTAQKFLIANREMIEAELRDISNWNGYRPRTVWNILNRLLSNANQVLR